MIISLYLKEIWPPQRNSRLHRRKIHLLNKLGEGALMECVLEAVNARGQCRATAPMSLRLAINNVSPDECSSHVKCSIWLLLLVLNPAQKGKAWFVCYAAMLQRVVFFAMRHCFKSVLCFGAFMVLESKIRHFASTHKNASLGSNSSLIVCWNELNFVTSASTHAWPGQEAIDAAGDAAQQQENRSCIAMIMKYRYISPYIYRFVVTCLNKDLRRWCLCFAQSCSLVTEEMSVEDPQIPRNFWKSPMKPPRIPSKPPFSHDFPKGFTTNPRPFLPPTGLDEDDHLIGRSAGDPLEWSHALIRLHLTGLREGGSRRGKTWYLYDVYMVYGYTIIDYR